MMMMMNARRRGEKGINAGEPAQAGMSNVEPMEGVNVVIIVCYAPISMHLNGASR
jgi:hypothetical protein